MRKGNVQGMDAIGRKDIDGSGNRRRRRRHKDRETAILKFLDDECGNKGFFNFGQSRLPDVLFTAARQLLGQAPEECITGDLYEERFLQTFPGRSARRRAGDSADKETASQHKKEGKDLFGRHPLRRVFRWK